MYFVKCSSSDTELPSTPLPNVSKVRFFIQLNPTASISEAGSPSLIVAEVAPFKQTMF